MKIDANAFKLREGAEVDLSLWATKVKRPCKSKKAYHKVLKNHVEQLSDQQRMLYASNRHSLLLVFQAMDTAGKDGAIRHVMSGVNPQGCQVFSFQHPSARELKHDFLWRTTRDLPERGRIGIFNPARLPPAAPRSGALSQHSIHRRRMTAFGRQLPVMKSRCGH
jgi:polyphosphate kinase 2 (PPK2 family)